MREVTLSNTAVGCVDPGVPTHVAFSDHVRPPSVERFMHTHPCLLVSINFFGLQPSPTRLRHSAKATSVLFETEITDGMRVQGQPPSLYLKTVTSAHVVTQLKRMMKMISCHTFLICFLESGKISYLTARDLVYCTVLV